MGPESKSIHQVVLEQKVEKLRSELDELRRAVHGDPFVTNAPSLRGSLDRVSVRLARLEIAQYVVVAVMVGALIVYVVSS